MKTTSIQFLTLVTFAFTLAFTSCEKTEVSPFEDFDLKKQQHEWVESNDISTNGITSTKPIETELTYGNELRRVDHGFSSAKEPANKGIQDELTDDPSGKETDELSGVEVNENKIVRERPEWPIHNYPQKYSIDPPSATTDGLSDDSQTITLSTGKEVVPYSSIEKRSYIDDCKDLECEEKIAFETARYQEIANAECRVVYFTVTCCLNGEGLVDMHMRVSPNVKCAIEPIETKPEDSQ